MEQVIVLELRRVLKKLQALKSELKMLAMRKERLAMRKQIIPVPLLLNVETCRVSVRSKHGLSVRQHHREIWWVSSHLLKALTLQAVGQSLGRSIENVHRNKVIRVEMRKILEKEQAFRTKLKTLTMEKERLAMQTQKMPAQLLLDG